MKLLRKISIVLGFCALGLQFACAPTPMPALKIGEAYAVNGKYYQPKIQPEYREVGYASWYGKRFHNKRTANGEIFDKYEYTAAHKTLPLPSIVKVTNLTNGRSILVRVNDRGPFVRGRIIDLSENAAGALGFKGHGTAKVMVELDRQASLDLLKDPRLRIREAEKKRLVEAYTNPVMSSSKRSQESQSIAKTQTGKDLKVQTETQQQIQQEPQQQAAAVDQQVAVQDLEPIELMQQPKAANKKQLKKKPQKKQLAKKQSKTKQPKQAQVVAPEEVQAPAPQEAAAEVMGPAPAEMEQQAGQEQVLVGPSLPSNQNSTQPQPKKQVKLKQKKQKVTPVKKPQSMVNEADKATPVVAANDNAPRSIKAAKVVGGNYAIQVASATTQAEARNIAAKLSKLSSKIVEANVNGKKYFRVHVVGLASAEEAKNTLSNIKSKGFKDAYVIKSAK